MGKKIFDGKYTLDQLRQNFVMLQAESIEIPRTWLLDLIILAQQNEILKKHWLDLFDKILAEHDKDGWCRLSVAREEVIEMKKLFDGLNEIEISPNEQLEEFMKEPCPEEKE